MAKMFDPSVSEQWLRLSINTPDGQYMIIMPLQKDYTYQQNGCTVLGVAADHDKGAFCTLSEHEAKSLAEGGLSYQFTYTPHDKPKEG